MSTGELFNSKWDPNGKRGQIEHNMNRDRSREKQSRSMWEKADRTRDQTGQRDLSKRFEKYTPTTVPIEQVLMEIRDNILLRWPEKMKAASHKRTKGRYCLFHQDRGHSTHDCYNIKEEVKDLI